MLWLREKLGHIEECDVHPIEEWSGRYFAAYVLDCDKQRFDNVVLQSKILGLFPSQLRNARIHTSESNTRFRMVGKNWERVVKGLCVINIVKVLDNTFVVLALHVDLGYFNNNSWKSEELQFGGNNYDD